MAPAVQTFVHVRCRFVTSLERDGLRQVYFAQDSPCDDNTQPYHTGLVASWVNKDRTFRRTPRQRCQVCYWCIIEDSRKRQHHHRHLEHKDTKTCRETSGTNKNKSETELASSVLKKRSKTHKRLKERFFFYKTEQDKTCKFSM